MRWMGHVAGEERVIRRFLIFPLKINCEWRWLEWAWIHQSYHTTTDHWSNDWFVNKKEMK